MGKPFDGAQFRQDLAQFTGTEQWYKTMRPGFTFTDGVKYVAEVCGAYWMIDYVLSYQGDATLRLEGFQVWKFTRTGSGMSVAVEDGNNHILSEKFIEYSDFPVDSFTLWLVNGVILLPSEY